MSFKNYLIILSELLKYPPKKGLELFLKRVFNNILRNSKEKFLHRSWKPFELTMWINNKSYSYKLAIIKFLKFLLNLLFELRIYYFEFLPIACEALDHFIKVKWSSEVYIGWVFCRVTEALLKCFWIMPIFSNVSCHVSSRGILKT